MIDNVRELTREKGGQCWQLEETGIGDTELSVKLPQT